MSWIIKQITGVFGPYIIGALIVIVISLSATLSWARIVTIPALSRAAEAAEVKTLAAEAREASARSEAALRANERDALRSALDEQNRIIQNLKAESDKKAGRAAAAAAAAAKKPLPLPPGKTATEVSQWSSALFSR